MPVLLRIVWIIVAYLVASTAAGAVIAVAAWVAGLVGNPVELASLPYGLLAGGILVAVFAALPCAAIIGYAEREGRRTLPFHLAAGGLTGIGTLLGSVLLLGGISPRGLQVHPPDAEGAAALGMVAIAVAMAGLAGGLVYWALAGRSAGAWRAQASGTGAVVTPPT